MWCGVHGERKRTLVHACLMMAESHVNKDISIRESAMQGIQGSGPQTTTLPLPGGSVGRVDVLLQAKGAGLYRDYTST